MSIQLPLVFFTLFAGAGGGTMVFLCLAELFGFGPQLGRRACYVVAGLLVAGGLASVMHLAQKLHIMSVVMNLGSFSGISMELIGLTICFVLVALYWLFCREGQSTRARRVLGVLCGIAGLAFCWIQGSSYIIPARPYWDTVLLPVGYWVSGLVVGGIVFLALMVATKEEQSRVRRLIPFALGELAIQLVCWLAYGIAVGPDALAEQVLLFWGLEMVVGTLVPAVCLVVAYRSNNMAWVWVALAGVVVGGVVFRSMMWILGAGYFPSLFEVAATQRGWIGW